MGQASRRDEATESVHGLRAGLAIYERRRDDIVRIAYARAVREEAAPLVRWASSRRVPCHELPEPDLERFARSSHHEGLCLVTRARRWSTLAELADCLPRGSGAAIALDRVRNPYNVGAILRSAAFFGIDAALLGAPAPDPGLAPTAVRVAEGGAERLLLARTTDLAQSLAGLRARGIQVVGAEARAPADARGYAFGRPIVVVVGHEREGLGERVRAQCDARVGIRGAGHVDSLNVAVAAGVLMGEVTRRR